MDLELIGKVISGVKPFSLTKGNLLESDKFNDYYYEGKTLWQIFYMDRTDVSRIYNTNSTSFIALAQEDADRVRTLVGEYNTLLSAALAKEVSERTARSSCTLKVGSDFGIASLGIFRRNKLEEDEEAKVSSCACGDAEDGPYGGAFRDWADYYHYRGIY